MKLNHVKESLHAHRAVVGTELSRMRSLEVVRIFADAGYEFFFIDLEHTPFSLETVADMVAVARASEIVPLVRIPDVEYSWVARILDLGAQGIIVPRIASAQQVEEVVRWTRYPPLGVRGFALTRHQTDGVAIDPAHFMEHLHHETLVVIQIERKEALDNLEEILRVPGVDVACLGYMDLSVDLGIPGSLDDPRMIQAIERLIAAGKSTGVATGIMCNDLSAIQRWVEQGMQFIASSTDGEIFQQAASHAAERLRDICHVPRYHRS
ncbi:MAG: aldolase/citrate lyase family protein [Planctomycetota bacterium]